MLKHPRGADGGDRVPTFNAVTSNGDCLAPNGQLRAFVGPREDVGYKIACSDGGGVAVYRDTNLGLRLAPSTSASHKCSITPPPNRKFYSRSACRSGAIDFSLSSRTCRWIGLTICKT